MIVVSDTTAITSLIQVGRDSLLKDLYGEVLVPRAVAGELTAAHPELPRFLRVESVQDGQQVRRLLNELDQGEAEAIVLAKERAADLLLMDETVGRRIAQQEGVRIIGLLGVLVQAKQQGFVTSVRELTTQLEQRADFRVSEPVKQVIFRAACE